MKKDYLTMKWTLHFFETLESTNDTAKAYPIGSVIIADIQTGGKGRNGRMWQSPKGNLFLSAVLPDYGDLTPYLSFLAGVAVVEALPEWPLKLKWPNDVLLDGKKICGILLEREENKVIMGIGINVSTLPTGDFLYRVGCLKGALSLEKVRERVLISLSENLKEFEESGFAGIYSKWMQKAAGIGEKITVNLPRKQCHGIFKSLDLSGALVLETPGGVIEKIAAGDIFFTHE